MSVPLPDPPPVPPPDSISVSVSVIMSLSCSESMVAPNSLVLDKVMAFLRRPRRFLRGTLLSYEARRIDLIYFENWETRNKLVSYEVLHKRHRAAAEADRCEEHDDQRRGDEDAADVVVELQVETERVGDGPAEPGKPHDQHHFLQHISYLTVGV